MIFNLDDLSPELGDMANNFPEDPTEPEPTKEQLKQIFQERYDRQKGKLPPQTEEMTPELEAAFELVENLYSLVYERSQIVMFEIMLGRDLTEEELFAIEIVFDLDYYEDDKASLTDEQQAAIAIVENLELEIENSDVNDELLFLMMFIGRPLTDEEEAAFDIVIELMALMDEAPSPSIEVLVAFYENILGRALTELEIEAIQMFEVYEDDYYTE